MTRITLSGLVKLMLSLAALIALVPDNPAHAGEPGRFSTGQVLEFSAGSAKQRSALSKVPAVRELVAEEFAIAVFDLNDDGSAEIVLHSRSSSWCGSGGCALSVLEKKHDGRIVEILSHYLQPGEVAVTREKVKGYRALASLDERGAIALGDRPQTPLYGRQLVYPMRPPKGSAGHAPSKAR